MKDHSFCEILASGMFIKAPSTHLYHGYYSYYPFFQCNATGISSYLLLTLFIIKCWFSSLNRWWFSCWNSASHWWEYHFAFLFINHNLNSNLFIWFLKINPIIFNLCIMSCLRSIFSLYKGRSKMCASSKAFF